MAEAVYVHEGVRIHYTPTAADVAEGQVVVIGELVGVATQPISKDAAGTVQIAGVFRFAKSTGDIAAGTKLYWDDTNNVVTSTAAGNKYIGRSVEAAVSADTTVLVKIES